MKVCKENVCVNNVNIKTEVGSDYVKKDFRNNIDTSSRKSIYLVHTVRDRFACDLSAIKPSHVRCVIGDVTGIV